MIFAVLFDLDETLLDRTSSLVDFLADQHRRFSRRLGAVPLERFRSRFLALDGRGSVHKSLVYPALLDELCGQRDAAAELLDDYRVRCCNHARGFAGMGELLATLRLNGLKLGIVTNGEAEFQTRHIDALEIASLVDAILISESERMRKPDRELFLRAADRLGVEPSSCLFVGDNPVADILGAAAAGMQTAWLSHGHEWPPDLPPMPGVSIGSLTDLLLHVDVG
jgi:putative hydrolase of the HAD superfamily